MNPVEHALFFASLFGFLKWLVVLNIGIFGAWTIYVLSSSKPRRRSHKGNNILASSKDSAGRIGDSNGSR